MPVFRYKAISDNGRRLSGFIESDSLFLAKEQLLTKKLLLTEIELSDKRGEQRYLKPSDLLGFTSELAQFLRAGLPLYQALQSICEKRPGQPLLLDICQQVKGGVSLAESLKKYPKTFDDIYLSMVESAEESGALEQVFSQLALLIQREQRLKKKLIAAAIYPAFLASFAALLLLLLLLVVIPTMRELFEDRPLHPLTAFVLLLSEFVTRNLPYLLLCFLSALGLIFYFFRAGVLMPFLERLFLRVPLIKTVIFDGSLVRFSYCLSLLLQAQIPLLKSLSLAKKAMKGLALKAAIDLAESEIASGKGMSQSLAKSSQIPRVVVRMIATAEETGHLPQMLQNICLIYEESLEKKINELTTFFQPIILIVLGGIIGLILLAILLPLTDVGSLL